VNSNVITKHQQNQPMWLIVMLTAALLFCLVSLSGLAYKKWIAEPDQQKNQSELMTQQQHLLSQDDVINTNWLHTLNPLVKNVEGRVVWSSILQKGVMEFIDLPEIAKNQKYQLWIYDLVGKDTKPIFSNEFYQIKSKTILIPFSAKELILSPFKFELVLKTEGEELSQPLFLAQP
jgi:hypothetical protein